MRGPFDIADRMSYYSVSSPTLESRLSSSNSHSYTRSSFYNNYMDCIRRPNSIDRNRESIMNNNSGKKSGILLNKEREDLCWDYLFMVCGGTGITPMLQL